MREIVKASLYVFGRDGFFGASMEEIANKCGIAKSSIYFYFKDKKELFKEALKLALEKEEKMLKRVKSMKACFEDKIKSLIRQYLSGLNQFKEGMRLLFLYPPQFDPHEFGEIRDMMRKGIEKRENIFSEIIKEGFKQGKIKDLPLKYCVSSFFGMIFSFMRSVYLGEKINVKEGVNVLSDIYLNGILKRGAR